MSDLMNKAPTASEQMDKALAASVAKLKPMVQVKAYQNSERGLHPTLGWR